LRALATKSRTGMADGDIIIPDENVLLDWKRYYLNLDFYPGIRLTRRDGLRFAESASEYLELEDVQPGISEWRMAGGATSDGVHVAITKHSITLDVLDPPNLLEWYEHRFEPLVRMFGDTFTPQVALRRNAIATCLLDLPGDTDARAFLGGWVMLMHPSKLAPIERPLHVLGVRLFFPPFEETEGEHTEQRRKTDWSVNVRVESSIDDPGKLFLEADAGWDEPTEWNDAFANEAVRCMGVATTFVKDKVVKFLRQPPFPANGEDDNVQ